jgi:hypothetical protein
MSADGLNRPATEFGQPARREGVRQNQGAQPADRSPDYPATGTAAIPDASLPSIQRLLGQSSFTCQGTFPDWPEKGIFARDFERGRNKG